jgi:hypothetical protein
MALDLTFHAPVSHCDLVLVEVLVVADVEHAAFSVPQRRGRDQSGQEGHVVDCSSRIMSSLNNNIPC